jgi:hypothetical protein
VEFVRLFPTCGENNFCSLGASVRPYKVNCPETPETLQNGECPDVFTMPGDGRPELMNFRLSFGGGEFLIEVASAIGGGGALDPGRCLSLLSEDQRTSFLNQHCREPLGDPADCNVSVAASKSTMGGENDAWRVVANDVTALICLRNNNTSTVLGKATLTFGFTAIDKEAAFDDPF